MTRHAHHHHIEMNLHMSASGQHLALAEASRRQRRHRVLHSMGHPRLHDACRREPIVVADRMQFLGLFTLEKQQQQFMESSE